MKDRLAWIVWRAAAAPIVFIALFGFSMLVVGLDPDYPGGFRVVDWSGWVGVAALTFSGLAIGLGFLVAVIAILVSSLTGSVSSFFRSVWFVGTGVVLAVVWSAVSTYRSWQDWAEAPREIGEAGWSLDFTLMSTVVVGGLIGLVYFVTVDWFADRLDRFAAHAANKDSC